MAPYIMSGVALITGAASGIGRSCAVVFAEEGVTRLILADMNTAGLDETSNILKQLNPKIETVAVQTDISSPDAVQNMVDLGVKRFGSIHYAVNSAGVSTDSRAKSADLDIDAWDRVVNINLRGVWLCQRAIIQQMLKQDYLKPEQMRTRSPPERGCIVNISSVVGRAGLAGTGGYAASKHGVLGQTRTDAISYGADGIRINAVCPGFIETAMTVKAINVGSYYDKLIENTPIARYGNPEEIAQTVVFLASTRASYITGEEICVDGGLLHSI